LTFGKGSAKMVFMKENIIRTKSYVFALDIVKFSRVLIEARREYIMSKQLIKSGTSVGANVREALQAESRDDFIHKLSISLKEAHESQFWICLIRDSGYATKEETQHIFAQANEVIALLTSIIKSTKKNPHPTTHSLA
jgi:four helix bundle protein